MGHMQTWKKPHFIPKGELASLVEKGMEAAQNKERRVADGLNMILIRELPIDRWSPGDLMVEDGYRGKIIYFTIGGVLSSKKHRRVLVGVNFDFLFAELFA